MPIGWAGCQSLRQLRLPCFVCFFYRYTIHCIHLLNKMVLFTNFLQKDLLISRFRGPAGPVVNYRLLGWRPSGFASNKSISEPLQLQLLLAPLRVQVIPPLYLYSV